MARSPENFDHIAIDKVPCKHSEVATRILQLKFKVTYIITMCNVVFARDKLAVVKT
jgi:hypothetical protein